MHMATTDMATTRIVIAEDEAIPRMGLKQLLQDQGYDVVGEAGDGRQAVDVARSVKPDLVIMDIMMPKMDGITASRILAEERLAPVLLITAYQQRDLVDKAKEAGVFAYVLKPFTEFQLIPGIELALARFREFQDLVEQAQSAKAALETRKVVERAKALLMRVQGLSEADAYKHIQKTSMNRRKPMREVADAILLAHDEE
jgi:two-component system, response regulator PdtaR